MNIDHIGEGADGQPLAVLIRADAYAALPEIAISLKLRGPCAAVTDPPYDFDTAGGGKMRAARPYLDLIERIGIADGFDDSILTPDWFAAVVVFAHENQLARLKEALDRRFGRSSLCFWRKTNPPPWRNKAYLADVEFYLHAWTQGAHPDGRHADMGREVAAPVGKNDFTVERDGETLKHPTVKPLSVMDKIMRNVTAPLICDPFMGTGSTGVAAIRAGKRFVGIERDEGWFEIARARIGEAVAGGRVFWGEDDCPGHVGSDGDAKVCGRCGVHIDSLRDADPEDAAP